MVQAADIVKYYPFSEYPTSADLPYSDGEPLDSNWERIQINLGIECIRAHWPDREDYFAGGNMFVYYRESLGAAALARGPDIFLVIDVEIDDNPKSWIIYDRDNRFPELIIEFQSESTRHVDLGPKLTFYEQVFKSPEYFCFDPYRDRLLGWRLIDGAYASIEPDARGWLWSEVLGAYVGRWVGEYQGWNERWIRLYRPDGSLILTRAESAVHQAEIAEQKAEFAEQKAEIAVQEANAARQKAEAAEQIAEAQRHRAERLAALLKASGINPDDIQ